VWRAAKNRLGSSPALHPITSAGPQTYPGAEMISAYIAQLDTCSLDMYDQAVYGTPPYSIFTRSNELSRC